MKVQRFDERAPQPDARAIKGYCPEGAIRFSPGFQPWEALSKRICPEASGLFAGEIRFPGLKPYKR
jgi:hypothetical protein